MNNQLYRIAGIHGLMLAGFSLLSGLLTYFMVDMTIGSGSTWLLALLAIFGFFIQFIFIIRAQLKYQKVNYDMTYGQALLIAMIVFAIGFIFSSAISYFNYSNNPIGGIDGMDMDGVMAASFGITFIFSFFMALLATMITGMWRLFEKAGKPGWACIVPFYNLIVMCEIAKKPTWWILLCLIPLVNIVFIVMIYNGISKAFGKDEGWTVGLVLLGFVFFPLLAFGANYYLHEHIAGENPNQDPKGDDLMDHLVVE